MNENTSKQKFGKAVIDKTIKRQNENSAKFV
jgi:hypothetical protein